MNDRDKKVVQDAREGKRKIVSTSVEKGLPPGFIGECGKTPCEECGRDVWVSPSTEEMMTASTVIICERCAGLENPTVETVMDAFSNMTQNQIEAICEQLGKTQDEIMERLFAVKLAQDLNGS